MNVNNPPVLTGIIRGGAQTGSGYLSSAGSPTYQQYGINGPLLLRLGTSATTQALLSNLPTFVWPQVDTKWGCIGIQDYAQFVVEVEAAFGSASLSNTQVNSSVLAQQFQSGTQHVTAPTTVFSWGFALNMAGQLCVFVCSNTLALVPVTVPVGFDPTLTHRYTSQIVQGTSANVTTFKLYVDGALVFTSVPGSIIPLAGQQNAVITSVFGGGSFLANSPSVWLRRYHTIMGPLDASVWSAG